MSEETPQAAARRAELRALVVNGLALIADTARHVSEARNELAGEGARLTWPTPRGSPNCSAPSKETNCDRDRPPQPPRREVMYLRNIPAHIHAGVTVVLARTVDTAAEWTLAPRGWSVAEVQACTRRIAIVHGACGHQSPDWEYHGHRDPLGNAEGRRVRQERREARRIARTHAAAHTCPTAARPQGAEHRCTDSTTAAPD